MKRYKTLKNAIRWANRRNGLPFTRIYQDESGVLWLTINANEREYCEARNWKLVARWNNDRQCIKQVEAA